MESCRRRFFGSEASRYCYAAPLEAPSRLNFSSEEGRFSSEFKSRKKVAERE